MKKCNKKYFFLSMISTFYILALIIGFIIVEKTAEETIFEKSTPFLIYKQKDFRPELIQIRFMGYNIIFNF